MTHDPLTYRHPRNLIDAFGPDADEARAIEGPFTEHGQAMHPHDRIVLSFALAALLGFLAILIWS